VVAAFRIHCTDGAAGCRGPATPQDGWTDSVHGYGVGAYELTLLAAMVATAAWALRRGRVALVVVSLAAAAGSFAAVARIDEPAAGADQRLWLAVSTVWLLSLVVLAEWSPRRVLTR
jgi:hypothetical protein